MRTLLLLRRSSVLVAVLAIQWGTPTWVAGERVVSLQTGERTRLSDRWVARGVGTRRVADGRVRVRSSLASPKASRPSWPGRLFGWFKGTMLGRWLGGLFGWVSVKRARVDQHQLQPDRRKVAKPSPGRGRRDGLPRPRRLGRSARPRGRERLVDYRPGGPGAMVFASGTTAGQATPEDAIAWLNEHFRASGWPLEAHDGEPQ